LIDCPTLSDPRTNPVPIGHIINGVSDTFVNCVKGTFCGVAINEINCRAPPRALENADENDIAHPGGCSQLRCDTFSLTPAVRGPTPR
jgi:hypothetical protein